MLKYIRALMPREDRYFELFERHAALLVKGAEAVIRLFRDGQRIEAHCHEIQAFEDQADDVTREVLQSVRRTFITPFDRSAITSLIGSMDDAIDEMNATGKAIMLYEVTQFRPCMVQMADVVLDSARVTAEVIPLLRAINKNGQRIHGLTERIIDLEGRADALHDTGLKELFVESRTGNAMEYIVGREVYSHLEKVVDRFEDVANEIQGLAIDHA